MGGNCCSSVEVESNENGILSVETETESKEDIDKFIEAFKAIADEAKDAPDLLHNAPGKSKVRRLDEVSAARKPCLAG